MSLTDGSREYGGVIVGAPDEWRFTVLQFRAGGEPPQPGRDYSVTCVKQNGIHRFYARLLRSEDREEGTAHTFQYTGGYARVQRRNAFRCPMALNVKLRKIRPDGTGETPWAFTKTVNLSEGGMCVGLDGRFAREDRVECTLYASARGTDVILPGIAGRIVWTLALPDREGAFLAGVEFGPMDRRSGDVLLKLVALGQGGNLSR